MSNEPTQARIIWKVVDSTNKNCKGSNQYIFENFKGRSTCALNDVTTELYPSLRFMSQIEFSQ